MKNASTFMPGLKSNDQTVVLGVNGQGATGAEVQLTGAQVIAVLGEVEVGAVPLLLRTATGRTETVASLRVAEGRYRNWRNHPSWCLR